VGPRESTTQRDRDRTAIARGHPACHICGNPIDYTLHWLDPMAYVVDHIIPRNRGGPDTIANKAAAHRSCNRAKSDREYAPIVRRSGTLD
jgi:5-methylcytosine-specific restriction endonuclease McrA